jgi:nucleoside 2-deoxyribosyltransferase
MRRITDAGHTITYDWTEGFDREPEMTEAELTARAIYDIDGVRQADAVIVYMQPKMHTAMTGAAIETGAALVLRTPVIVVEEEVTFDHFFQHHTAITKVPTMQTALDMLASYQR